MTSSSKYFRFAGIFFLILVFSFMHKQFTPRLIKMIHMSSMVVKG